MRRRAIVLVLTFLLSAGALAAGLLFAWGQTASHRTEATTIGPGTMNFRVKSGSVDCAATAKPTKCTVAAGGSFSLAVAVTDFPAPGYVLVRTLIDWTGTGLTYKPTAAATTEIVWPDKLESNRSILATSVFLGSFSGFEPLFRVSTHKGNIVNIAMNCTAAASSNKITLVPFSSTEPSGSGIGIGAAGGPAVATSDSITINCGKPPTPTPTRTVTPTPTAPPTAQRDNLSRTLSI